MTDFLKRIADLSPKRLALLAAELEERVRELEGRNHAPIAIVGIGELATATGAFQLPIAALSPDPQFQSLVLLVDFLPVHAVSGPLKDSGEVIIGRQLLSLTNRNTFLRRPGNSSFPRIPAQSRL